MTNSVFNVVSYVWEHPANSQGRVLALIQAARAQATMRLSPSRKVRLTRSGVTFDVASGQYGISKAIYAWPPDYPEMRAWQRILRAGDTFIDVGANAGLYSLWAGWLGAHVTAFEPSSEIWDALLSNVALNPTADVKCVKDAVGASSGLASITIGRGAENVVASGGPAGEETEEVAVVTLDEFAGDASLRGVKIDIEGHEIEALEGARAALAEHRIDVLQVEWNEASLHARGDSREPCARLLRDCEYTLCRPDRDGRLALSEDISMSSADMFAVSPEYARSIGMLVN